MYVSLSVGMWKANGNPNPCTDLDKILHTHPHLSKEGFGEVLTPSTSPPWAWGPETLKLKDTFFKTVYKTKDDKQVAN